MEGIDIGLFDFDRHNALFYFLMNADENIYMRYGGRDAASASTYLNLRSLELALQQGLELHKTKETIQFPERPGALYPKELANLKARTLDANRCVECHLIADYQNQQREIDGTLDRLRDLYQSPDIKTIGIHLKVSKGLLLEKAEGAVAAAGLKAGDTLTHLNQQRLYTFADLQHFLNKVPRDAATLSIAAVDENGESQKCEVQLPKRWWFVDNDYRYWTVEPKLYFKSTPLSAEEKSDLGLEKNDIASRVAHIDLFRTFAKPAWKVGDIVLSVNGCSEDNIANTAELHIKLRHKAGSSMQVELLRDGEKLVTEVTTERQNYRK